MRIILFALFTLITLNQTYAVTPLADIFTKDIYDQSKLVNDISNDDKVEELKKRKLAALKDHKFKAIDVEIERKRIEFKKYDDRAPIVVPAALITNCALLWLGGPIGAGISLGIKYGLDKPKGVLDAVGKGFEVLLMPTQKIGDAFMPTDIIANEMKILEEAKKLLEKTATEGELFDLESEYIKKKNDFPETWQDKIESLLLSCYKIKDYKPTDLAADMVWHPLKIKTFTMEKRRSLQESITLNGSKARIVKQLLTKLSVTRQPHYGYSQTNDQDNFESYMLLIAQSLELPITVIDAAQTEPTESFLYGSKTEKGVFLSALQVEVASSSHFFVTHKWLNPILLIKNIDAWTITGDENLAWILKLFDKETKTFHSNYYGLDVDWSHLNVIGCGRKPKADLDSAFKSRVAGYQF